MTTGPVGQLSAALAATERLIAGVHDDHWADSTPCPDWSVRDLVGHLVGGNNLFARIMRGQPHAARQDTLPPGVDPLTAYRDSAAALLDAFGQPSALKKIVTVPFGTVPGVAALHLRITEVLVHGWDLARATRQAATFPEDLAEQELAFSRGKLADIPPGRKPFAPSQPVADDATAIDKLAACLGRDVTAHAHAPGNSG
jgi:uncharacterized protein (TIGR03086 family)